MTPAQREVLERLVGGAGLLRVLAPTARAMHRAGWIEPDGDYWRITAYGERAIERVHYAEAHRRICRQLADVDYAWGGRVEAWLVAVTPDLDAQLRHHIRHLAACQHRGIHPGPASPNLGDVAWLRSYVQRASECLRDLDEERELAIRRGVGLTVAFAADPAVPRDRATAAAAAAAADGVVDLSTYRARRPRPG